MESKYILCKKKLKKNRAAMEINFLVRRVSEWRAPIDLETDIGENQNNNWVG